MKPPSKTCRNCEGSQFYSRTVDFSGDASALLPIGFWKTAKCRVRVCADCGRVEWFLTPECLELFKGKFELDP